MGAKDFASKAMARVRNILLSGNSKAANSNSKMSFGKEFGKELKQQHIIRISAYTGLAVLAIYAICFVVPPFYEDLSHATTRDPVASDTVLSLSIEGSSLALDFAPVSTNGTFATTVNSQPSAHINVTTNNITGYTLGIKASGNGNNTSANVDINRNLISTGERCADTPTAEKCFISTLEEPVSYLEYAASTATDLNNTWGYMPSKYNSVDNYNYLPAPTSEGDVLDATSAPNALKPGQPEGNTYIGDLQPNEYTIDLGSRVDYTTYADSYSNTFIITAVGNPVPYSVSYNANKPAQAPATANVDNLPHAQTGNVQSGDTIAVLLSTKVPTLGTQDTNSPTTNYTYAGYVFSGWCNTQPTEDPTTGYQTCPVEQENTTLYQPGDTYGIDQTTDNTETLYAVWGAPATVTFNSNGLVYYNTATGTDNTVQYIPTYEGGTTAGQKQNIIYTGTYKTPAYEETDPVTNIVMKGWNTDQTATVATYVDEQAITDTLTLNAGDTIDLYAIWNYATVITFNGNGNDTDNTPMADITVEAGQTVALPQNTYTKEGYIFNGWNTVQTPTEQDPGETYPDQADYQAEAGSRNVTLYAQWKVPVYLYNNVAAMSKGTQDAAALQATITAPTTDDPSTDQSNSGVYKYDATTFGAASDADSSYAIYYYRGILEQAKDQGPRGSDGKATTYPNYVKLANNTCWRIVRTTGSGGVKMIYNGTWQGTAESGTCANSQTNAQLTTSPFNDRSATVAGKSYTGLQYQNMHAIGYTYSNVAASTKSATALSTLLGATGNDTTTNTNSSIIKKYIEDWYSTNMVNASSSSYTSMLEESAGYCNDRSVYNENSYAASTVLPDSTTVIPYGTSGMTAYYFGAYTRNRNTAQNPSLTCPRGIVDTYSTTTTSGGNGQLTHPIALLTADELSFAGSGSSTASEGSSRNAKSYLRSGNDFWLLSPYYRTSGGGFAYESRLLSSGDLSGDSSYYTYGVRPAISLKPGTIVASGSGTATDPWLINE